MVLGDLVVLPRDTSLGCHTEVGDSSGDGNQGGDDVVETAFLRLLARVGVSD